MIEVEKKVEITPELLNYVSSHGIYMGEIIIHDIYYDSLDYKYTTQNMWLRKRLGAFELKKGLQRNDRTIDRYDEITDPTKILKALNLNSADCLETTLQTEGVLPFAFFHTTRQKYQLDKFNIDIDRADFGNLIYTVLEIECMVDNENEIEAAESRIHAFLSKFQIDPVKKLKGKLIYYLSVAYPNHFAALKKAGVVV